MLKCDIYDGGRGVRVRFPARSWERAHTVIESVRASPPDGYKLTDSRVAPRSTWKGGRRVNVRLTLTYCDKRHPVFSEAEALEHFQDDAEKAQRVNGVDNGAQPHN